MTTPSENKKAEEKIIPEERFVSINQVIKIIDEAYDEYLEDSLDESSDFILKIKHRIRTLYSVNRKSLIKDTK